MSNNSNSSHSENCRVVNGETTSLKSKGDDQGSSEHYSQSDQRLDETREKVLLVLYYYCEQVYTFYSY